MDLRIWLICAAFFVVGILSLNDTMLYTPDSPRYLIWAKSLAAFEGFKDSTGPDVVRYVIHAPFYPLLLAPLGWFFQNIIVPAKIVTILFGVALIVLFFLWTAKRTNRTAALIGAFFLAINPVVIVLSSHVLSDVPFTLVVVLLFLLAEKISEAPGEEKWAWMFVVFLTAGILLREVGLTLLLGASTYFLLRKEYRRLLLIFTIPMLFYLIWYFRNEVYIAGIENPSMRNIRLFLSHSFTADSSSMIDELLARMRINFSVYMDMAKGLVIFPQFLVNVFHVVDPTTAVMAGTTKVLSYLVYPLIFLQYGLFGWGVVMRWNEMKHTLLVLLFVLFYVFMILIYPVNDIRFLLPLLVLVLYYAVLGGHDLAKRVIVGGGGKRLLVSVAALVGLLIAVPNFVWMYEYISINRHYLANVSDSSKPYIPEEKTPALYCRAPALVGRWIAEHSDSSASVLAHWKEITFWLNGRKMLDTDPLLSLTLFEDILRDYDIGYIVASVMEPGIREFEFQMVQSRKFGFTSVYRAGNLEVVQVHHLLREPQGAMKTDVQRAAQLPTVVAAPEAEAREMFRQGVRALESGRPEEARKQFDVLLEQSRGAGYLALFRGTALEFGGQFKEALWLFDRFRYQQQAGPFISHARYHTLMIRELETAERDTSKFKKALAYHKASANYWDLGFRQRALDVLNLALRADSNFMPGLIFGVYYALELGDTAQAKKYFGWAQRADPNHGTIRMMRGIFAMMDSVRLAKTTAQRLGYQLAMAKGFAAIGLRDVTIDLSLAILAEDPKNRGALVELAQAFDVKERRWPTIQALQRLIAVNPNDVLARERLTTLLSRQ